jgi:oligopeptide transport system substrate-binding protein
MQIFLLIFFLFASLSCTTQKKECTKSTMAPPEKQIFRMNTHSAPQSLDPRLVRDIPTVTTAKMFFDGLTRTNLQGECKPSIAYKITVSPDKKCYTFYLRDSFWSNGDPVTSYDFEYAWKSLLSPDFPSEYAHQLFVIKNAESAKKRLVSLDQVGVHTEGPKKLVVFLEHPDPYFLELTAFPISFPVPSETVKQNSAWASEQGEKFICNGPFSLSKWNHGSELNAQKNHSYWDRSSVKLDAITLTMIEDEHTELNMYENNELDWAGSPNSSIPPEALPSLKLSDKGEQELFVTPIAGTFCYKFNTKVAPFHSLKMRKAFALAIDRKSLIDNILQANQLVASSLLPPCIKGNFATVETQGSLDREKAIALFNEALLENAWTIETLPQITLIFSKSEKHQKIAQAVQQEWNNTFNIKVNLQSYEWNTFLSHLSKGAFQVGGRGWVSDLSDPKTILEIYKFSGDSTLGSNNDTGWENPEFIKLIDLATLCADETQRSAYLHEAERILLDEMPIAPLYHSTACYLKKSYVKDVYMSKLCDLDFKNAYIQR